MPRPVGFSASDVTDDTRERVDALIQEIVRMLYPRTGKYYPGDPGSQPDVPPVAVNDSNIVAVVGGGNITVDITANDTFESATGKAGLTINLTTAGLTDGAAAVLDGNNDVTFTPSASPASQSFSYTITDDTGLTSNSATVTISVQASAPSTGWTSTIAYKFAEGAVNSALPGPTPIEFDVTEPALRTTGNGGSVTSASGHDIRFELASDQSRVFFQRDTYDAATGRLTGYLRLPAGTDQAGLNVNILAGKSGHPDESDASGVWGDAANGYVFAGKSDGSNRVPGAGAGFTLGSGITTAPGEQDGWLFDGTANARSTAFDGSWAGGPTLSMTMKVEGDGTFGQPVGWLSAERAGGGYEYMLINLANSSGFTNLWVAVTQVGDTWGGWRGTSNSAFGGPNTISVTYDVSAQFTRVLRDGVVPDNGPTNAWGSATALNPINDDLVIGFAAQNAYWNGLVASLHIREREYLLEEHLLRANLLWRGPNGEKWQPFIPVADTLAVPPIGDTLIPPDPPELFPGDIQGTVEVYEPYFEHSVVSTNYTGNPFDVIATATFTLDSDPAVTRTGQWFYDGSNTFKMRFTADRVGTWSVTTASTDCADLNGLTGTITATANTDPNATGFVVRQGNRITRQINGDGSLKAWFPHVYSRDVAIGPMWLDPVTNLYPMITETVDHGMQMLLVPVWHNCMSLGNETYNDHNSEDPSLPFFTNLDAVLTQCRSNGIMLHMWLWGDEARQATPIGLAGGVNGTVDRRLQRYIAARIGWHPDWSMGYGFDLMEWASSAEVLSWHNYLNDRLPFDQLLSAREESTFVSPVGMLHYSVDDRFTSSSDYYSNAVAYFASGKAQTTPLIYARRFYHTRDGVWTETQTLNSIWEFALAGGATGMYGRWDGLPLYSSTLKARVRRYRQFWDTNATVGLARDNSVTNRGWALRDGTSRIVVYFRGNGNVTVDLSDLAGANATVRAVDVLSAAAYAEVDLGTKPTAAGQLITLPSSSDWALVITGGA